MIVQQQFDHLSNGHSYMSIMHKHTDRLRLKGKKLIDINIDKKVEPRVGDVVVSDLIGDHS